jgi:RNase P subunit RPR2
MSKKPKTLLKSSVRESIRKLVLEATDVFRSGDEERSKRYVEMAMDLVKKHRMRLPADLRNSFCRKCHIIWFPGKTVTIYFDSKNNCLRARCRCGHSKRI